MNTLTNKHILLGVTGGIAAYKSADLVRRLREHGAQVRVVMTEAATEFITPLTLQAVSGQRVHTRLLEVEAEAAMGHIELARWAEGAGNDSTNVASQSDSRKLSTFKSLWGTIFWAYCRCASLWRNGHGANA